MTDFEAYQEYIQRKHNAFCKAVIRYAARDKILQLRRKWERQISLDYLMDEKFVQFAGPEPDEAARAYGKANAWLYPTLGALSHFLYLDFEELRLTPWLDPDAPAPAARVSFRVSARALFVLIAAVQVLIRFYREKVLDVFL